MEFKTVLNILINSFNKEHVEYALVGGFALGILGVHRATVDMDFLVLSDDQAKIDSILKENGYECTYKSDNVSQYTSPLKVFGEVDFIHAFRDISVSMLRRAVEKDIFDKELKIKVLIPEDIIGLKVQALINNEERAVQEYSDIESLMVHYNKQLDWELIEEYFLLFDLKEKYEQLKVRYGQVKR
ncbi:MAG: nucleotidyltransferase [Candidatus Ancaeobacter aquaticus]|nr:nucleotidyltransferase [Candidatus Ancaeobacter aquaticus]